MVRMSPHGEKRKIFYCESDIMPCIKINKLKVVYIFNIV